VSALPASAARHEILGLTLDVLPPAESVAAFMQLATTGARGYCCVANVQPCVLVHDDPHFRRQVNAARLVLTDSTILQRVVALRLGLPFRAPRRGAELMLDICRQAAAANLPIALIGGRDPAALDTLCESLTRQFPDLAIAHAWSPPFRALTAAENASMRAALNASGARICFVGLGCPRQETWMATHSTALDALLTGVGAAFDVNAGLVRRSPLWVHRAGFDWLYRLASEPRRLWRRYLTTSPRFLALLWQEAWRGALDNPPP
jgi:N-acetylglucosaminyldiphosphoundecaprenol N-acetyl-beta-D-mannosaminyltransferase